jgi:hypothetical protein
LSPALPATLEVLGEARRPDAEPVIARPACPALPADFTTRPFRRPYGIEGSTMQAVSYAPQAAAMGRRRSR